MKHLVIGLSAALLGLVFAQCSSSEETATGEGNAAGGGGSSASGGAAGAKGGADGSAGKAGSSQPDASVGTGGRAGSGGGGGTGGSGTGGGGTGGSGTGGGGTGGAGTGGSGTGGAGTGGAGTGGSGTGGAGTGGAGTGGAGTGGAGTGGSVDSGACTPVDGQGVFSASNVWTKDVSCDPVDPSSKTITDTLAAAGGWGTGLTQLQMDMSLVVLHANGSTPLTPFQKAAGYYTPDCDDITSVPMPVGGNIEGAAGYTCDAANNDCHLLVVHPPTNKLYEVYQATMAGANLVGTCAVVWDLTKTYPANMRGDQCTSADAAGFPMSAMLPDADEVASGAILHAIRFALPNPRIRAGVYVHPASHAGGPSGGVNMPPYGVRFRLRANYPLASLPSNGARVIAKALQRFGMFLSDGGNVPLMVQDDRYTTNKWAAMNVDSHSLFGIAVGDFEIVDMGPTVALTYNCVRNP